MNKEKEEIRERYAPERVLENWRELLEALPLMNEAELEAALRKEAKRKGEKRQDMLLRLHRRFTKLRQEREFQELTSE